MLALSIKNVTVPVPGDKGKQGVLVNSANFDVNAGEVLTIIGPNGAGKSSLLKAIDGELPFTGDITTHGIDSNARARAKQFAFLPQQSTLSFPFTVNEVVELGRTPHATGKCRDSEIVSDALALMDISYLAERRYTLLSGGERQRVQLARVFCQIWDAENAHQNRLLLLDEPSAALDLGHQHHLMRAIKEFSQRGVAVVMVMHDINLAARYSDRMLALLCSEQIAYGAPTEVIKQETMQRLFGLPVEILISPDSGRPVVLGK